MATSHQRSSLLEALLRGTEATDSILIQDCVEGDGRQLLKALVSQFSKQTPCHLFLLESTKEEWSTIGKQLRFYDYYSDPLGWNDYITSHQGDSPSAGHLNDLSLQCCVQQMDGTGGVVVFDSLSPLLLHQPGGAVTRLLHGLKQHCSMVISLVHADVHEDHVISQLSHVTSTSITLQPHTDKSHQCSIQQKRKSGKVTKQMEIFSISADYSTLSSSPYDEHTSQPPHHTSQADPTANLTFDLTLTAKEKQDRANVVLPYTRPHISIGQVEGQIFYQPDEADDFDESDPDDDLDI